MLIGAPNAELAGVLARAERLYTDAEIGTAISTLAGRVNARLGTEVWTAMCVLHGGVVFAGRLLGQLTAPVRQDYVHASRYRERLGGDQLKWRAHPATEIGSARILLLDDILDEGITLDVLRAQLLEAGAAEVVSAVLVRKNRAQPPACEADFFALEVPDRYVFGAGMDYKGWFRNAPGIFAASLADS
ncbi:MAG: hypoxanthine-guanine phosphoribosyltransferase [Chromatiales bacterium]|nr:hypoxanthine-guanine phosphoribosyltransferase [Chromatiales bacterium]